MTSLCRMTCKPANFCWDGRSVSVYTRIPIFVCFAGRLVKACHRGDRRVYMLSFLGVPGVTVGWPRTKGTASNERVYSFCGFLPNPFIQDLCLWHKVFDLSLECHLFDRALIDNRPLLWSLPTVQLCGRKTTAIKKNSHFFSRNVNEWGIYLVVWTSFHWQKKIING